jgi:mono/diheme cytochrome c family protein
MTTTMSDQKPSMSGRDLAERGSRRRAGATTAALVGVTLLGAGACGDDLPPELAQGRELFLANCAMCHGDGARGDGPMAASLPVQPPSILEHLGHHTGAQLVTLIRSGVPPAMPPQPLSEEEVGLVVDYVWTLVPESEAAALRAMRDQMEAMQGSAAPAPMSQPADSGHEGHMMPPSGSGPGR